MVHLRFLARHGLTTNHKGLKSNFKSLSLSLSFFSLLSFLLSFLRFHPYLFFVTVPFFDGESNCHERKAAVKAGILICSHFVAFPIRLRRQHARNNQRSLSLLMSHFALVYEGRCRA